MVRHGLLGIAVVTIALFTQMPDAQAKRLGSARSFGKQQSALTNRQAAPSTPSTTPGAAPNAANSAATAGKPTAGQAVGAPAPAAAPAPNRSRWLGPLAGVAAGLGIAALMSHFGMGGELASFVSSFLLVAAAALLVMFAWRWLRSRAAPARPQPAYAQRAMGPVTVTGLGRESMVNPQPSAPLRLEATQHPGNDLRPALPTTSFGIPEGFDVEPFLRNAKVYFVRLQAAWDAANLADIREFTTPEVFAEIKIQIDERGSAANQTDVVTLDAEILGVTTSEQDHLASVRFHGMLRENPGAPAQEFDEVWNLVKPLRGTAGWLLAGVQQIQAVAPAEV